MTEQDRYVIKRRPRQRRPLPEGEVKIPRPKSLPSLPMSTGGIFRFLPMIATALIMGSIRLFLPSASTISPIYTVLMIMAPMLTMGLINYFVQRKAEKSKQKAYQNEVQQKKTNYFRQLRQIQQHLDDYTNEQCRIMNQENPSLNQLFKRVENLVNSLWERQPGDNDFLTVRIGVADQPLCVKIQRLEPDEEDQRIAQANQLADKYSIVENLPVLIDLNGLGSIGVKGNRPSEALYAVFTLLVNIAVHHSPDEVYLYIFSHHPHAHDRWQWVRWLPHTRALHPSQDDFPHLSFSSYDDEKVLEGLLNDMRRREERLREFPRRFSRPDAHLVIVFDHTADLMGREIIDRVLVHEPGTQERNEMRISGIFIDDPVPSTVNATITINGSQFIYYESWAASANQMRSEGTVELATPQFVERLARAMAPLRTLESFYAGGGGMPTNVRLVTLLQAQRADELDFAQLYSDQYDPRQIMTFPIGINIDQKVQRIALREKGQKGNGQHAILAGGTGGGKSVTLQSIVLGLAGTHPPSFLNFILADFKAGASELARLKDLPHVVGFVTDLNQALVERFRLALEGEIERRKTLFAQTEETLGQQVTNIYQYNELCQEEPMPHLVIVIDEFHRGRQINPAFQTTLDNGVAAQGRALGMHLLLSTQKAEDFGPVLPNIEIRMSMRMNSTEDSKAIFKREEAYTRLTRPGQAYVQCLRNEQQVFEMFQVARADEPFVPEGELKLEVADRFVIERLGGNGRLETIYEHQQEKIQVIGESNFSTLSEAEILVRQMQQYCEGRYEATREICLPPLLPLTQLPLWPLLRESSTYSLWQNGTWQNGVARKRLIVNVGMLDFPRQQEQWPFSLDLNQGDGNFMIVGPAESGKGTFLQTIMLALALTHSPDDIWMYILSDNPALAEFSILPHCGSVVSLLETERVIRLLQFVGTEIEQRLHKLRQTRASSIHMLRHQILNQPLPALILIIESFTGVRAAYEEKINDLQRLIEDGRKVDVHIILGSNAITRVTSQVRANMRQRIALGARDAAEYQEILGKKAQPMPEMPGRGYVIRQQTPIECQIAAPSLTVQKQLYEGTLAPESRALMQEMDSTWSGNRPQSINVLPSHIVLAELWKTIKSSSMADFPYHSLTAPLGLYYDNLRPVCIDYERLNAYSAIVGNSGSGKTEFLMTLCLATIQRLSPERIEIFIFSFKRNQLLYLKKSPQVHLVTRAQTVSQLEKLADNLAERSNIQRRYEAEMAEKTGTGPLIFPKRTLIIIDDLQIFLQEEQEPWRLVDRCMENGRYAGVNLIIADTGAAFAQMRNMRPKPTFIDRVFQFNDCAVLLTADQTELTLLRLNAVHPVFKQHGTAIGKGRAFFIQQGGRPQLVQFAAVVPPHQDKSEYKSALAQLLAVQQGQG